MEERRTNKKETASGRVNEKGKDRDSDRGRERVRDREKLNRVSKRDCEVERGRQRGKQVG